MGCFVPFISIFYIVGLVALFTGIWDARESTKVASWPTVPATITSLRVRQDHDGDGGTSHKVMVEYTYIVDGNTYASSRLAFGYSGSSGRKAHDEIYERLKQAKTVAARYDPADPAESCLSFGLHQSILRLLVFSSTWMLFVVGITIGVWLHSRSDKVLLNNLSVH